MATPDRLRVLLLAQWYEPVIGGEETHVRTLAQELARRGHEVSVAALAHPDRPRTYSDGAVTVHRIRAATQRLPWVFSDSERQSAPSFPDPGVTSALRRIVGQARPHVVHAHNWMVYSYLPVRLRSAPLVLTLHDQSQVCAKKVLLFQGRVCDGPAPLKCLRCTVGHYGALKGPVTLGGLWTMAPLLRREVDAFVAVSRSVADLSGLTRRGARIAIIPNFLGDESFAGSDVPPPAGLPSAPFLMFAGSLSRIKGIDTLLRAFAALDQTTRPPLVMIGYRGTESIESLVGAPAGVTVITDQPREAVSAAWDRSLFGVVPSIVPESFGLAALEAMARGRPVVASRIGGLPEVVEDGETGILVPPGDVEALRRAIDRLLSDTSLRQRLALGARRRAAQFSADLIVPRIEALYRDLLVRRSRAGAHPARRQPRSHSSGRDRYLSVGAHGVGEAEKRRLDRARHR